MGIINRIPRNASVAGGFVDACDSLDGWTTSGLGTMAANGSFYASAYGSGYGWHGPMASKEFNPISGDFECGAVITFTRGVLAALGNIYVRLYDESGGEVCNYNIFDNSTSQAKWTYYFNVLGQKEPATINSVTADISSKLLTIRRIGSLYTAALQSFATVSITSTIVPIAKFSISFSASYTDPACGMSMASCYVTAL